MDLACELVKLPWIYRKALLVLNQLQVMLRDCLGLLLGSWLTLGLSPMA